MSNLLSITPLHQIQSSSGAGHKFQHRICRAGRAFASFCLDGASSMLSAVETAHSDPTACLNRLLENIKEPYLFWIPQLARSAILATPTSSVKCEWSFLITNYSQWSHSELSRTEHAYSSHKNQMHKSCVLKCQKTGTQRHTLPEKLVWVLLHNNRLQHAIA